MKRQFIIRIVLFLLALIVANTVLDQLYKRFVVHNLLNNTKDEQFDAYTGTLKYLSLGNSHNCVNTYILENSFNYGSPGENYIQSYYKLKSILEKPGKRPENVILFADISSFGPLTADRLEYNSYWIKYIDYFELAKIKKDRDILSKWLEGKFFSFAGNYKDIQLTFIYAIKIGKLELHNGYRPHRDFKNFAREQNRTKQARAKANIYLSKQDYPDKDILFYFEKILQLCQDHGINVILIRIPVTREYFEEASNIVPVDELYEQVQVICANYPNVTRFLDYHDLYFDHPEYFFDPDHLNPRGSDLFTERLKLDLEGLP
ncbi:MAG: DUF1574 family protein [Bacteroidales bacterium]|nr:DUF1574 family protein [Bacteroidales bacterium]